MKQLSIEKMQEVTAGGVGACIFACAGYSIAAATMLTFSGGFLAFAVAYGSYVFAVDSVLSYC